MQNWVGAICRYVILEKLRAIIIAGCVVQEQIKAKL